MIIVLGHRSPLFQVVQRSLHFQNMVRVLEVSPNPGLKSGPITSPKLSPWLLGNRPPTSESLLSQQFHHHFDYFYTYSHTKDATVELYTEQEVLEA